MDIENRVLVVRGDEREGGEKRNCVMELLCSLEKLMPDRMKITITEN